MTSTKDFHNKLSTDSFNTQQLLWTNNLFGEVQHIILTSSRQKRKFNQMTENSIRL